MPYTLQEILSHEITRDENGNSPNTPLNLTKSAINNITYLVKARDTEIKPKIRKLISFKVAIARGGAEEGYDLKRMNSDLHNLKHEHKALDIRARFYLAWLSNDLTECRTLLENLREHHNNFLNNLLFEEQDYPLKMTEEVYNDEGEVVQEIDSRGENAILSFSRLMKTDTDRMSHFITQLGKGCLIDCE
jgi:hypothetical protein